MQGRFHRRLYALHHLAKHGFFVYSRHARVHVEYVRARFNLLYRARRHIAHIAFEQRFLHRLFARGIYPLAYNAHPVQIHHFARAANRRGHLDFTRLRLFPFCNLSYLRNISGGRAATAAQYIHADFQILLIHCGELARAYRIVHVFVGKSRVRLDEKRLCRVRSYPLHDGQNLIRSQRTVHADNVRKRGSRQRERLRAHARKRSAALFKGHTAHHGKRGIFPRGKKRRPEFGKVGHGFYDYKVGSAPRPYYLGKYIVRLFLRHTAQRFQKRARGSYVQGDEFAVRRETRYLHRRGNKLRHFLTVAQLDPVRAESVGVYDVAARLHIAAVYLLHQRGVFYVVIFGAFARGHAL